MATGVNQRKDELFATITLLGGVERQIAEMQAAGAPFADLLPLLERKSQLEADEKRLTLEVYNESLYGNLGRILAGQDDALRAIGGLHNVIDVMRHEFSELGETVSGHGQQIAAHTEQIAQIERRLDTHERRINALEQEIRDVRAGLATDRAKLRGLRHER